MFDAIAKYKSMLQSGEATLTVTNAKQPNVLLPLVETKREKGRARRKRNAARSRVTRSARS